MNTKKRWMYAVVGIVTMLMVGLIYAWSVISKAIGAANSAWSAAELSLTFTMVMACFCIGGLVGGILSKKWNVKALVLSGAVLQAGGLFVASVTGAAPVFLYIGFGIMAGLGAGFAYNAVMSTMTAWFPDKQGLISGLMLMGFGFSSFFFGKIYAAVTPSDGSDAWRMTFRAMAVVIIIVLVICGILLKRPKPEDVAALGSTKHAVKETALDVPASGMARQKSFWLYYLWGFLMSAGGLIIVSQASGISVETGHGIADGTIATVVGLISIMNGIGRVVIGILYDKKGHRASLLCGMLGYFAAAVLLIAAIRLGIFGLVIPAFMIGGFAYGGVPSTNSAIASEFFGRTYYRTNYPIVNTCLLPASFASMIAGRLYDISGSYLLAALMLLVVTLAALAFSIGIRRPA